MNIYKTQMRIGMRIFVGMVLLTPVSVSCFNF